MTNGNNGNKTELNRALMQIRLENVHDLLFNRIFLAVLGMIALGAVSAVILTLSR